MPQPIQTTHAQTADLGGGLFAVFETNQGPFVCKLEEEKTPETVANFVGLATGEKEYVDPRTQAKSTEPFYNGTIFHRVIKQFMVQAGDRLGQGVGGPGYRFKDEFHPSLRHDAPGVLSMANAGPNTNGSQFFVTVVPTPWLDGKHSVFGKVVKGLDLVLKISNAPTGPMDRPREEIRIERLEIVRQN